MPPPTSAAAPRPEMQASQMQRANRARRLARYEEVLGLARQTVARWLRADGYPERAVSRPRRTSIAPYEAFLRERWQAGCQNARQLWREVQARGFTGGHETVRRLVVRWRTTPGRPGLPRRQPLATPPPAPPPFRPATRPRSPRQARWLLVKPADMVRPAQQAYLRHLGERCPALLVGQRLTVEFQRLVRERDHAALAPWLAAADASALPEFVEFAKGIARDRAAVEAALTTAWSNGQTEARVLQLKAVRRQMRGRGGFALVRRRVVTAA